MSRHDEEAGLGYPHAVLWACLEAVQAHPHVLQAGSLPIQRDGLLEGNWRPCLVELSPSVRGDGSQEVTLN